MMRQMNKGDAFLEQQFLRAAEKHNVPSDRGCHLADQFPHDLQGTSRTSIRVIMNDCIWPEEACRLV